MNKSDFFVNCIMFIMLISISHSVLTGYAQVQSPENRSSISSSGNDVLSSSASVSISISNQTLKTKEGILKSAVNSFIKSGAIVLEASNTDAPMVKTNVTSLVNDAVQIIEGAEATNAIIGVEIEKALRTKISSNQTAVITIDTSSVCKPLENKLVSCTNIVTIK